MEKRVILTQDGLKKIESKLDYLISVRRLEVAERIKQALEFGDISENSEYEGAKTEQAFIEGEILTLENMIRNAKIIESSTTKGIVSLGSKVELLDLEENEVYSFEIVGSAEADPLNSRISNECPVGVAIMGKKKDSVVDVDTPGGILKYKILSIE